MSSKDNPGLLFLDFDGVLCDSLLECHRSSWLAFHQVGVNHNQDFRNLPVLNRVPSAFQELRPWVRSGEDYVLIQRMIHEKATLSARTFQEELETRSPQLKLEDQNRLYQTRNWLLTDHSDWWLSGNPLYPGVSEGLEILKDLEWIHILSTKKKDYIQAILYFQGIKWPATRIHWAGLNQSKSSIMANIQALNTQDRALLLDDYPQSLRELSKENQGGILATWGYADPIEMKYFPCMELNEFAHWCGNPSFERLWSSKSQSRLT